MTNNLINRPARLALQYYKDMEKSTGEPVTLGKYLLSLGAQHPQPMAFTELEKALAVTPSQVSRATRSLHKMNHRGNPGRDLVDITFDIQNPRLKLVGLNRRGVRAVEVLVKPWMH